MHTGARAGQAHAGPQRSVCSSAGDTRENVSRVPPTSGRLAPGLPRGGPSRGDSSPAGPGCHPRWNVQNSHPPGARRARTLTPQPEQRGSRPLPPTPPRRPVRTGQSPQSHERGVHAMEVWTRTDRRMPRHRGGREGTRGDPQGAGTSRGSPWRAQAVGGGLLRCSRSATRVACRRRTRGARGGGRARGLAGRAGDRKSTRLNSSHRIASRMPSSA